MVDQIANDGNAYTNYAVALIDEYEVGDYDPNASFSQSQPNPDAILNTSPAASPTNNGASNDESGADPRDAFLRRYIRDYDEIGQDFRDKTKEKLATLDELVSAGKISLNQKNDQEAEVLEKIEAEREEYMRRMLLVATYYQENNIKRKFPASGIEMLRDVMHDPNRAGMIMIFDDGSKDGVAIRAAKNGHEMAIVSKSRSPQAFEALAIAMIAKGGTKFSPARDAGLVATMNKTDKTYFAVGLIKHSNHATAQVGEETMNYRQLKKALKEKKINAQEFNTAIQEMAQNFIQNNMGNVPKNDKKFIEAVVNNLYVAETKRPAAEQNLSATTTPTPPAGPNPEGPNRDAPRVDPRQPSANAIIVQSDFLSDGHKEAEAKAVALGEAINRYAAMTPEERAANGLDKQSGSELYGASKAYDMLQDIKMKIADSHREGKISDQQKQEMMDAASRQAKSFAAGLAGNADDVLKQAKDNQLSRVGTPITKELRALGKQLDGILNPKPEAEGPGQTPPQQQRRPGGQSGPSASAPA